MAEKTSQKYKLWDYVQPFAFGGFSSTIAASLFFPFDKLKVRLQQQGEKAGQNDKKEAKGEILQLGKRILKKEGFKSFYIGVDATIFRQMTYAAFRLGLYKLLYRIRAESKGSVPFTEKIVLSSFSGLMSSFLSNPIDVCLLRIQTINNLPKEERKYYTNIVSAMKRVWKKEGFSRFYDGIKANMLRVMITTSTQLTSMDQAKEIINEYRGIEKSDHLTRISASMFSGLMVVLMGMPFDNIRVKLQKMIPDENDKYPYKGVTDCFKKSIKREGFLGLWIGFRAAYLSNAPFNVVSLVLLDWLHFHYGSSCFK